MHGTSAHPLYAQSLFVEHEYAACAPPIKHVVTRHARMAAATPMLGISEAVGALYRRGCSSAAPAVTKEWLAANNGGQRRCRRANTRKFLCRELLALWSLSVQSFETLRSDHAAPMQCGGGIGDKTCAHTSGVKIRPLKGRNRTTSVLNMPGARWGLSQPGFRHRNAYAVTLLHP